jgi:hypothetical protein
VGHHGYPKTCDETGGAHSKHRRKQNFISSFGGEIRRVMYTKIIVIIIIKRKTTWKNQG